jgi:hypothetical protein
MVHLTRFSEYCRFGLLVCALACGLPAAAALAGESQAATQAAERLLGSSLLPQSYTLLRTFNGERHGEPVSLWRLQARAPGLAWSHLDVWLRSTDLGVCEARAYDAEGVLSQRILYQGSASISPLAASVPMSPFPSASPPFSSPTASPSPQSSTTPRASAHPRRVSFQSHRLSMQPRVPLRSSYYRSHLAQHSSHASQPSRRSANHRPRHPGP